MTKTRKNGPSNLSQKKIFLKHYLTVIFKTGATFEHTKKSSQHISLLNTFLIKNA
jgi:hypothetical protein